MLLVIGGCVGLVVLALGARIAYILRQEKLSLTGASRHDLAIKAAVESYVASRGGSVRFDGLEMHVKGSLGEGRASFRLLQIQCDRRAEAKWPGVIAHGLRDYVRDPFDDEMAAAYAIQMRIQMRKLAPVIAAWSDEELRGRLRADVVRSRSLADGLTTCARPLLPKYELRTVLHGIPLDGVPPEARARFPEDDDALMQLAMAQTLGPTPRAEDGGVTARYSKVWLARASEIFGTKPYVIVPDGDGLRWTPATPELTEARFAALVQTSMESRGMKAQLLAWDGAQLHTSLIVPHTIIIGPTMPHYTMRLPVDIIALVGIEGSENGSFGVRRH